MTDRAILASHWKAYCQWRRIATLILAVVHAFRTATVNGRNVFGIMDCARTRQHPAEFCADVRPAVTALRQPRNQVHVVVMEK